MNKVFSKLVMVALAATTVMTSCKKDDPEPGKTPLNSYSTILLGAQNNAEASYYSATENKRYSGNDAQNNGTKVDITYAALGASLDPTILSYNARRDPSTGLTATVPANANKTYFKMASIDATKFLNLKNQEDADFASIDVKSSDAEKIMVEQNKVYQFLTQGGKKGYFHVQTITGGLSGAVTLNVKIQK